ncbi:MAG TPA: DUF2157 domain-containing protein [Caulobacterales bacterium]|nr:DUF2157 domain-containing protein [Caulobacterales bacterium]
MRDGAYLKRLAADLTRWRQTGVLSEAQADTALADARAQAARPAGSFSNVAAALGAVLFGLGIITFIGANWDVLPKLARLAAVLALLWLAFGGAVIAFERKNDGMGHALALIGALSMGGAIALIGQTYHIEGSAAGLLIPWAVGVLLAALVYSSRALLILYAILAFLYFAFDRPGDFFLDHGPSTRPSPELFGVYYLPLLAIGAWIGRRWDSGAAMHLSGLAALAWLVLLFVDSIWLGESRDFIAAGCMLAAAGAALAAVNEFWRLRTNERAASIWLAWSCGAVLIGLVIAEVALHEKKTLAVEMVFAAAALALSVWAINWGEAPGRKAVRVFAVLLFGFECFFIYFALFGDMMFTAQFLLGAGALLLAVAFALRRLTRMPKQAEAAP